MLTSIRFYTKVSLKSILLIVAVFVTMVDIFTRLIGTLDDSIFLYTKYFLIPFIFFHIYLLINSSSMMYQEYLALSFLEKDKGKKMISIVFANIIITLGYGLISVLVILAFKNSVFSSTTVLMGLGHFIILLFTGSLLAITIGITTAVLLKNELSIVISLTIYGLLLAFTYGSLSNKLTVNYLQAFLSDDTFIVFNEIAGVLFTKDYFADKLVVLCFSTFILSLAYFLITSIKRKGYLILPIFSFVAFSCLIIYGLKHQFDFYHAVDVDQKIFEDYKIEEYNMQVDLHNELENETQIKLTFTKDSDTLPLLLDPIFTVENIKVNNQIVEHTFSNNLLIIHDEFTKNSTVIVEIRYKGKVDVKKDIGSNLFYVTPYAVNLVGGEFFWYPSPIVNDSVKFTVEVGFGEKLYSNLPMSNGKLHGDANYVSIFSGIYTEYTEEGIRYIYPPTMSVEGIKRIISGLIVSHDLSNGDPETLKNKKYDQVIVAAWAIEGELFIVENSTLYIRLD